MGRKSKKDRPPNDRIPLDAAPRAENRYAVPAVCGFLLLAVALVFGQAVGYGFVNYDDDGYVYENSHLTRGLAAEEIVWAFTTTQCNNWHPLTWLSYLLDSQLYGAKPWGYHLTNILLHAAAAIVLFLVLRRMTGDLWPSAFVAAVFAVHPLRTESVVWIAERKDVLSGLLFMLTLAAYVSYVRRPWSLARYMAVVVLFALGLMAKPMLVTLPLVLMLLDYWPLGRMALPSKSWGGSCAAAPGAAVQLPPQRKKNGPVPWRLVVEKLPLLALSAASCVATSVAQRAALARFDLLPLGSRAANALVSCVAYMGQFFYPVGLAVFYPHLGDELPIGKIVGASLLLAVITVGVAVCWRRRPWLPVGWFWYLGMLVPAIGLVQVGAQSMADRYTYLPQIGLVIGLAWGAKGVVGAWPYRAWLYGVASAVAVAALMGCTWQQTTFWSSTEALWNHDLSCTVPSSLAHYNLGTFLFAEGRIDEAIGHYRETLDIKPNLVEGHNNLGIALVRRGDFAEAMAHYRRALELKPDFEEAYGNLGLALFRQGHLAEAIEQYEKALKLKPDDAKTRCSLGEALIHLGRSAEAIEQYEKALKSQPDHAEAHSNLGLLLAGAGRGDEAVAHYQKALEIKPNYADAHNNLGLWLAGAGRVDEAVAHYRKALELNPALAIAHQNLAITFFQRGKMPEAIGQWREVIRLQPENSFALNQLARMLATNPEGSVRNGREAVEVAQRAVALTGGREASALDTLAAAQAEAGRFAEAVDTAGRALALASGQNNAVLAGALRTRIKLYQEHSPYRESGQPSPPRPDHP